METTIHSKDTIINLIRKVASLRLKQYLMNSQIAIGEISLPQSFVLDYWTAIILVAGPTFRLTFKVHFNSKLIQNIRADGQMSGNTTGSGSSNNEIGDFVKEYCNITAGYLRAALEKVGVTAGTSLPFVTRGFDHAFSVDKDTPTVFHDTWCFNIAGRKLNCSFDFEILESDIIKHLELLQKSTFLDTIDIEIFK